MFMVNLSFLIHYKSWVFHFIVCNLSFILSRKKLLIKLLFVILNGSALLKYLESILCINIIHNIGDFFLKTKVLQLCPNLSIFSND